MTMQRATWDEQSLYRSGYQAIRTFTCDECLEEVTVYEQKLHGNKRLYLTSDMEVHPYHEKDHED